MSSDIPFIKPNLPRPEDLLKDYEQIIENNWYTNFGPFERTFRKGVAEFIGQDISVSTVNNATSGLMAALLSLLGKGDGTKYIVVPSFTFVAGPQVIVWCGYKPLFVDIDPKTLQTDINQTEKLLQSGKHEIAAIFLCNTLGVGDPMIDKWETLCESKKLPLLIDSAAGFGSKYTDGEYLGARGSCEIFSFHATKPFAVGEGGAVTSTDKDLIAKIDSIQNFGFTKPRDAAYLGFNGKMQEVNAAIGIRQLQDFKNRLESRAKIYDHYIKSLSSLNLKLQANAENSSMFCFSIILPNKSTKNELLSLLQESGIQARDYYNPLVSQQQFFIDNPDIAHSESLDTSNQVASSIISLPIHDSMDEVDLLKITNIVNRIMK